MNINDENLSTEDYNKILDEKYANRIEVSLVKNGSLDTEQIKRVVLQKTEAYIEQLLKSLNKKEMELSYFEGFTALDLVQDIADME
jgi:transposase